MNDFSNEEIDELCASQYDNGAEDAVKRIVLLLKNRRASWLASDPANAMTLARADEDDKIIDAILAKPEIAI